MIQKDDIEITEHVFLTLTIEANKRLNDLEDQHAGKLTYHNKKHTLDVASVVEKLIDELEYDNQLRNHSLKFKTLIAAYWHDLGYKYQYNDNEQLAACDFRHYCSWMEGKISEKDFAEISQAILCTNLKTNPTSDVGKFLRDADLHSIGSKNFIQASNNLRTELEKYPKADMHNVAIDYKKWRETQLAFISNHKWITSQAQHIFKETHKLNIEKFRKYWTI